MEMSLFSKVDFYCVDVAYGYLFCLRTKLLKLLDYIDRAYERVDYQLFIRLH